MHLATHQFCVNKIVMCLFYMYLLEAPFVSQVSSNHQICITTVKPFRLLVRVHCTCEANVHSYWLICANDHTLFK